MRPVATLRQLGRELDALRLAARQRRRRLAELDVVEPDVVQRLQPPPDLRDLREEAQRLLDGHLEHVGDRLALVADLERLAVVAPALADLARDVDVGQEVHLDLDRAVALARLAAAALDVEREAARLVAAHLRLGRAASTARGCGRTRPVYVAGFERGVRPIGDWSMSITLSNASMPSTASCAPGFTRAWLQAVRERLADDLVDERRLARAGHAGDADEAADRDLDVDRPSGCAASRRSTQNELAVLRRAAPAPRSSRAPDRNWPVIELRSRITSRPCPRRRRGRRARPRPGPCRRAQSAARIVSSSCSTTRTVLPRSRSRSSVSISRSLSRWCSPIDGSSRM